MSNAAIHYSTAHYGTTTACGRDIKRVACWDDYEAITCKRCRTAHEQLLAQETQRLVPHQCTDCERYFADAELLERHACKARTVDAPSTDGLEPAGVQLELTDSVAAVLDVLDPTTIHARGKRIRQLADGVDAGHHHLLSRIDYATSILEEAELARGELVNRARADGESWTRIGRALGMSKQAAQQRYGRS